MCAYPKDWSAFKCQSATYRKEILQSQWDFVRPMRQQAMVAHADAETSSHPIQENRGDCGMPIEHEQRGDCPEMEKHQSDDCWPVHPLASVDGTRLPAESILHSVEDETVEGTRTFRLNKF